MRTLLAAILMAMPFAAFADEAGIQVDHVWARAAPAGHEGAVFSQFAADGGAPDTLTGVTGTATPPPKLPCIRASTIMA